MEVDEPLIPMAVPLFSGIKKMTNDLSDLNETPPPMKKQSNNPPPKSHPEPKPNIQDKSIEKPKKKGGFWSNLFGRN